MTHDTRDLGRLLRLVKAIVNGYCRKVPSFIDRDDVLGAALLGLADALTKRSPDDLRPFAPYAHTRIRGSILDYLRVIDPLTREQREKAARGDDMADAWGAISAHGRGL